MAGYRPKYVKCISKDSFFNLTIHNKLKMKYMTGTAIVVKGPYVASGLNCVDVKFKESPWNDKVRRVIQQQVDSAL